MWEYDSDEGIWTNQIDDNLYTYNPVDDEFTLNNQVTTLANMPPPVVAELENTAREKILTIIGDATIELGESVEINALFEQDEAIETVGLNLHTTFGSNGATPCLIIFAVGLSQQDNASFIAKGAHRSDAFNLGGEFVEEILNNPSQGDWKDVKLYVVGGEVGKHTGVQEATMDYSMYYPFFFECYEQEVIFGGVKFPSNPNPDDSTSAVLRLQGNIPTVTYWLED